MRSISFTIQVRHASSSRGATRHFFSVTRAAETATSARLLLFPNSMGSATAGADPSSPSTAPPRSAANSALSAAIAAPGAFLAFFLPPPLSMSTVAITTFCSLSLALYLTSWPIALSMCSSLPAIMNSL